MRHHALHVRSCVSAGLVALAACQQVDQVLSFEVDRNDGATVSIGAGGGIVSVPPSFSMRFPASSYNGTVTVARRVDQPFPDDAGVPVPGTAFDIGPAGTSLTNPATVEVGLPVDALADGDEVRVGLALMRSDQSVTTSSAHYDVTNGILSAEVDEIGPVAVVLLDDAIRVSLATPPTLPGGSISPAAAPPVVPTTAPGPSPSARQVPQFPDGVVFEAACSPTGKPCFSSGIVRVWADETVRRRLGDVMYLVAASVSAQLEFFDFDLAGVPRQVLGQIALRGELRTRINRTVTRDEVDETESTGLGPSVLVTTLTFDPPNHMVFGETDEDIDVSFEYGVTGIGTGELLVLRLDGELTFDNGDQPDEVGDIVIHLRLRR